VPDIQWKPEKTETDGFTWDKFPKIRRPDTGTVSGLSILNLPQTRILVLLKVTDGLLKAGLRGETLTGERARRVADKFRALAARAHRGFTSGECARTGIGSAS
jgi:hypothetical protein